MVSKCKRRESISLIRYADDFVILHEQLNILQICQKGINKWLTEMGLELNPSKTKVTHTLEVHEGNNVGFNFLGFNIRQYKVGKQKC